MHFKQAKLKSQINEQQALEIATGWLTSIDVSLSDLEKTNKPEVEQRFFYPDATPTGSVSNLERVLLPIFNVTWAHNKSVAIEVTIYGPTKELLSLKQEDDSFSRRAGGAVKSSEELLRISDDDFANYSEFQLRELLTHHATVDSETSDLLRIMHGESANGLRSLRSVALGSQRAQVSADASMRRPSDIKFKSTNAPSQTNTSAAPASK